MQGNMLVSPARMLPDDVVVTDDPPKTVKWLSRFSGSPGVWSVQFTDGTSTSASDDDCFTVYRDVA